MGDIFNIFVRSVFIDNMVFAYFLGMCSYLAVSKNVKTSFGLGLAVCFVLTVTVPVNYLIDKYLLREGALTWLSSGFAETDLSFLSLIIFIAVIAGIVQLLEMVFERYLPALNMALGIFLPLIAVNCAILGGSLFMQERNFPTVAHSLSYALGSGLGWLLAITAFAAIRERLRYAKVPPALQGNGTVLQVDLLLCELLDSVAVLRPLHLVVEAHGRIGGLDFNGFGGIDAEVDDLIGNTQTIELWSLNSIAGEAETARFIEFDRVHNHGSVKTHILEIQCRVLGLGNGSVDVELSFGTGSEGKCDHSKGQRLQYSPFHIFFLPIFVLRFDNMRTKVHLFFDIPH